MSTPTNELGFAALVVSEDTAESLPTPRFGEANADNNGEVCNPKHALIGVEGGSVRYRVDGTVVQSPFGMLATAGTFIDWTDPLRNFQSFIQRCSVIAEPGTGPVTLTISWRD
mgnify:CR=1 FL=1